MMIWWNPKREHYQYQPPRNDFADACIALGLVTLVPILLWFIAVMLEG